MAHTSSTQQRGNSVWITLSRDERNLLDAELTEWLRDEVRKADAAVPTAIVLTGAGDTFCGGADGPYLRESGTAKPFAEAAVELFNDLHTMSTPVIAAVNGNALAGGFGLVCLADIVVAVSDAQMGTIEASLGGWPMIAQAPVLARMQTKAAIQNLLTGVPFSASRGVEVGVVDEVVPRSDLEARIENYVALLEKGRTAARLGRPLMRAALDPDFSSVLRAGADAFVEMFS